MLMALVNLVPPAGGAGPAVAAPALTDLLWPHVAPADGVEHLYTRAGPRGIELVAFCPGTDQSLADIIAFVICQRAIDRIPALRGWRAVPLSRP